MDTQRFPIKGRVISGDDPSLQDALAQVHESAERLRCLCVPGGIEMDVARRRYFVVKRMPETGSRHHPGCTPCEPDPASSGLDELVGDAVRESQAGEVDCAWISRGREPRAMADRAPMPECLAISKWHAVASAFTA